ncbi:hypothetical protein Poli38472_007173 [Pythium oligandrum]|uniref:Vesicle transport protein n=1 Tax=Pythium oligandrum TaxID=41045 RepID=A0A8K1C9R4_PYTOL|nr:hypothetical protein Poli38472_007173 [Pythium oligandrum]|eukprot:TMW59028.1 hypothetical protein Poli38472_007173 [Pythium oligandrum]
MSAWEQWGSKRPGGGTSASGVLNGAQSAFQSLINASPLSTASTVSSDGDNASPFSMKKMWDSAQNLTKVSLSPANTTTDAVDALESGEAGGDVQESDSPAFPLWRRKTSETKSSMLPAMSWNSRFKYFVGLALMALMFFGMSSIFLPLIMIRPSKFALSFTFGSMCAMGAFAMLKGPAAYAKDLLQSKTIVLTTFYFLTLGATLYSCLVLGSYMMVVFSSVCQLITLGIFALSVFPGGNASLKTFGTLFMKAARQMIQAFLRLLR